MTETSQSEAEYCSSYMDAQATQVLREVPVGNCLLEAEESLIEGAHGPLSMRADGIQSTSDSAVEILIECKQTPSFTAVGQLLIYSYLRKRDRDIVWERYTDRGTDWETKGEISGFQTHVFQRDESSKTYQPKPRLKRLDKHLVVGDLDTAVAPILAGCQELGIAVDHPESGRWQTLRIDFGPDMPEDASSCESWVTSESRKTTQSESEELIAEEFCTLLSDAFGFSDMQLYREVPIGSQLSSSGSARRADLLVKTDDIWLVVEIKQSPAERTTRPFLKGVGQASVYATLFATEWDLKPEQVIPVVVQYPLAKLGDRYRDDRYEEDYHKMFESAQADMSQPVIIGHATTFA